MLSYEQAENKALKEAGGGFEKDIDLDYEQGTCTTMRSKSSKTISNTITLSMLRAEKLPLPAVTKATLTTMTTITTQVPTETAATQETAVLPIAEAQETIPLPAAGNNSASSGSGSNGSSSGSGQISRRKARSIVLSKVPGATIIELQLERDDGIYVYEGEARKGNYEYSFEINASSGVIISWEKDYEDDWD